MQVTQKYNIMSEVQHSQIYQRSSKKDKLNTHGQLNIPIDKVSLFFCIFHKRIHLTNVPLLKKHPQYQLIFIRRYQIILDNFNTMWECKNLKKTDTAQCYLVGTPILQRGWGGMSFLDSPKKEGGQNLELKWKGSVKQGSCSNTGGITYFYFS